MDVSPFVFVVAVLASYRIIRLWLYDTIAAPLHRWVIARLIVDTSNKFRWWLAELLNCQWCLGIWVGFAVAAIWFTAADNWNGAGSAVGWLAVALAIAAGQSFLHLLEDRLSDDG
jgi:hypothetical protein